MFFYIIFVLFIFILINCSPARAHFSCLFLNIFFFFDIGTFVLLFF